MEDDSIAGVLAELGAKNLGMASGSCGCMGPQNGEPLCRCQMRGVVIRNGRYVRVEDLGPVRSTLREETDLIRAAFAGMEWDNSPTNG